MSTFLRLVSNYTPWLWLGIAVVCAVVEGISFELTTIWFALSAVLMIFISLLHLPVYAQCLLFVLIALGLMISTRPLALKFLHIHRVRTNADSLIGKTALITKGITEWEKGQAKVNGVIWTAASADGTAIPEESECVIKRIEGVTLIVQILKKG